MKRVTASSTSLAAGRETRNAGRIITMQITHRGFEILIGDDGSWMVIFPNGVLEWVWDKPTDVKSKITWGHVDKVMSNLKRHVDRQIQRRPDTFGFGRAGHVEVDYEPKQHP